MPINPELTTPKANFFAYDNTDWYRRFLLRLRYSLDTRAYENFANVVAGILNNELKFAPVRLPDDAGTAQTDGKIIRRDGLVSLGQLVTPGDIATIRSYLAKHTVHDGWERVPGRYPIEAVPERVHVAHFDNDILVDCPHLIYLASHPRIIARVSEYLGTPPTIHYFALWWSLANRPEPEDAQLFHIDRHCYRFVKLFVYLTDVDMETGPHCYIRGSADVNIIHNKMRELAQSDPAAHQRFKAMLGAQRKSDSDVMDFFGPDKLVYVTGNAGDTFLVNTAGYHKAYLPKARNRLAFQVLYTMLPTIKDPVKPINVPNFLETYRSYYGNCFSDDHLMYMNRLVIRQ